MHDTLVRDLALVLGVAAVTSVASRLLRQSPVLGYLLAGLIVGPNLPIPLFADPGRIETLAELGVVLVMFGVGLELRLARLARTLPVAGLIVLVEAGALAWSGVVVGQVLGWTRTEALFLGASLAISSTMIASRVLAGSGSDPELRKGVLGVLVVQDVLAIVLIALMTGVALGGGLGPAELSATLARLAGVLVLLLVVGLLCVPRMVRAVLRLEDAETSVVLLLGLCFGVAALAREMGYSVALGAFLAGLLVAESGRGSRIEPLVEPLRDVFAAVFFVSVGMTVDPAAAWEHLPLSLVIWALVVAVQLASVLVAGLLSGFGLRRSVQTGLALGQIGEFAFILATIGVSAGVVRAPLQAVLVTVAVLSAASTAPLLRRGERLADLLDRLLPRRIRTVLGLYESWLERWRASLAAGSATRSPAAHATRALVLDALGLLVLLAATAGLGGDLARWLGSALGLGRPWDRVLVGALFLALATPVLAGFLRNGVALARLASEALPLAPGTNGQSAALAHRALATLIALAILLGAGLPTIAVLRPLTGRPWGIVLFALAALVVAALAWRAAGAVTTEYRSGAWQVAQLLAKQGGPAPPAPTLSSPTLVPGLDAVFCLRIEPGAHAVGKTLAELNVRARTGATVVAIHRPGSDLVLPTGRESLQAGDTLAMAATHQAHERARALLVEGAHAEQPQSA